MNFLAHLHIAEATPESQLGNLLGDFVKGLPWDDRFPDEIWQGIMEHRFIDVFTDNHPAWKRSRERLNEKNRRFAGIVVDVFYDFFLHRHWHVFEPARTVEDFISEVHGNLWSLIDQAPAGASEVFEKLIKEQWLMSYGSIEGVRDTLRRVAEASPNLSQVEGLEHELVKNMAGLESDFLTFYPAARLEMVTIRNSVVQKHKTFVTERLSGDIR